MTFSTQQDESQSLLTGENIRKMLSLSKAVEDHIKGLSGSSAIIELIPAEQLKAYRMGLIDGLLMADKLVKEDPKPLTQNNIQEVSQISQSDDIAVLKLNSGLHRSLKAKGINTVYDLIEQSETDLFITGGNLYRLKQCLKTHGLTLKASQLAEALAVQEELQDLHSAFTAIKGYFLVADNLKLDEAVLAIKNIYGLACTETNGLIQTLQKENEEKRKNILAIREAADIQVTVGDGLIATCIRDKMGEIATLNAALKHANVEFTKVWAHREKGGRYRNLGEVIQEGTFADKSENKEYVAYQCLESGKIYLREGEDFDNTMWIIENLE